MTGLEYYRRKKQYSKAGLARCSGVCKDTIKAYEKFGISENASVDVLLSLADALEVPVDDLIADCEGGDLTTRDRATRTSKIQSPGNAVNNYRMKNNLRYQELANLLGLAARESARKVCTRATARDVHVRRLCQYEGLTMDEFRAIYLPRIPAQMQ